MAATAVRASAPCRHRAARRPTPPRSYTTAPAGMRHRISPALAVPATRMAAAPRGRCDVERIRKLNAYAPDRRDADGDCCCPVNPPLLDNAAAVNPEHGCRPGRLPAALRAMVLRSAGDVPMGRRRVQMCGIGPVGGRWPAGNVHLIRLTGCRHRCLWCRPGSARPRRGRVRCARRAARCMRWIGRGIRGAPRWAPNPLCASTG